MNSGQLLKTLRFNLGLTQNQLAKELGSSQQVIAMIENGHRGIPKSMSQVLWDKYKILCYSILSNSSKKENSLGLSSEKSNEITGNLEEGLKVFKINIIATVKCRNKKELLRLNADSFLQDIEMLDIMEPNYEVKNVN